MSKVLGFSGSAFGGPRFKPANSGLVVAGAVVAAGLFRFNPPNIVDPEPPDVLSYVYY
jgi:hypothetical protein